MPVPSAFPLNSNNLPNPGAFEPEAGMNLLDYFAAHAVPAIIPLAEADYRITENNFGDMVAKMSYGVAICMLKHRNKLMAEILKLDEAKKEQSNG